MTNSQMQVKEVNFQGDTLLAAQDNKKQIWASVRMICKNIGFTKNQIDNQIDKIHNDIVLSKGAGNFPTLTNGGEQVTLCILIEFLPLWLAKISITPTMKKNNPKLVEKLIAYQLKAKDVLAAAFLPQQNEIKPAPQTTISTNPLLEQAIMSLQQSQQSLIDCTVNQSCQLNNHEERVTKTEKSVSRLENTQNNTIDCLNKQGDILLDHEEILIKHNEHLTEVKTIENRVEKLEKISRIVLPDVKDKRSQGDNDTLSDDEFEAQCASNLPSKEFAKWVRDTVNKVASNMKAGACSGNVWQEAYKGLQMPNGKQIQHLSELIDECHINYRYIVALRLTTALHQK